MGGAGRVLLYCERCRKAGNDRISVSIPIKKITPELFLDLYRTGKTESSPPTAVEIVFGEKIQELIQEANSILESPKKEEKINLFDIVKIKSQKITPSDCKLHLACRNGFENPINEYLAGTFEEWQSWQNKQNFKRKYIISLIQLPKNNHWLFAGIFRSLNCEYVENEKCYHYQTSGLPEFKDLSGRLIFSFKRTGRQSYLNAEKWANRVNVVELKAKNISVAKFPGYNNVLISKNILDIIVTQSISSWESALANVAGVYLITDTSNGKHYVGSATGDCGIWQRWCEYSLNGHGGNKELKRLLNEKGSNYSWNFQYSILEIADTHSGNEDILSRESFWKDVLCSREHGYNAN